MLIDSHCHVSDRGFDSDRREMLQRACEAGVSTVLAISSDREDAEAIRDLIRAAREWSGVPELWGTAGVHPHEAEGAREGDLDRIQTVLKEDPALLAVGETGLDFYYDNSPRAVQEALFRSHMEMADSLDLPIVVHSREADDLTAAIIKEWEGRVVGVLHCFTGGPDLLQTALGAGWMISFTGMVTFKKYDGGDLVRSVPQDRLMIETDAPYLAPVPFRGKRNEPGYVGKVADGLAVLRVETPELIREYTTANARRFFRIPNAY
jgi:TatD DNase family protein